jgi:hypothetical protein
MAGQDGAANETPLLPLQQEAQASANRPLLSAVPRRLHAPMAG